MLLPGHRLAVLYELAEVDSAMEILGVRLKYQSVQATGSEEWLTLSVRYKTPKGEESALLTYPIGPEALKESPSDDTVFAACEAQTGMLLRESGYAGSSSYADVVDRLEAMGEPKENPCKEEFLYLVKQLARRS